MNIVPMVAGLVARGLESGLAMRIAQLYPDWNTFASASSADLSTRFAPEEVETIRLAKTRRSIPEATVRRLVEECHFRCCVCWNLDADAGVVIHHIESHATTLDDSYDNLIVLCPNHHSQAHVRMELARQPLPPDLLRAKKRDFISALAAWKAGDRVAPGRERTPGTAISASPPAAPRHFVGRAGLMTELRERLATSGARVVLIGMGGVGKTALALRAAENVMEIHSGGVFWSDLFGAADGLRRTLRAWLRSLGHEAEPMELEQQLVLLGELLTERIARKGPVLLLLDDANEQMLEGLRELLEHLPPTATLLLTARELTVPTALGMAHVRIEPLDRASARELLRAVSASTLLDSEPQAVESLLGILGELPLAAELVGRQISLLEAKPGFSISWLCQKLKEFDSGLLSFPGHRGIAASFALSYDYLTTVEQSRFRALGAFALDDLDAVSVAAVVACNSQEAEQSLDRLVAVSMLGWAPAPATYRIHPLLHQYAEFLLGRQPEVERVGYAARHCQHFTGIACDASAEGKHDLNAIDRVLPNVTAAILRAHAHREHEAVTAAMLALWSDLSYFPIRNLEIESIPLLQAAADSARILGDAGKEAAFIASMGIVHDRTGKPTDAIACYERAIAISRPTGDLYDLASHLQNLGAALVHQAEDLPRAERVLNEALDLALKGENTDAAIGAMSTLGGLHRESGNFKEAAKAYRGSLEISRLARNRLSEGNNLSNLGLVLFELGQGEQGEKMVREALGIARELGDSRGEGNRTGHLGTILATRADSLPSGPERQHVLGQAREYQDQRGSYPLPCSQRADFAARHEGRTHRSKNGGGLRSHRPYYLHNVPLHFDVMKPTLPPVQPETLLSRADVATLLGVTKHTIRMYERRGLIRALRINQRTVRYERTAVQALLSSSRS